MPMIVESLNLFILRIGECIDEHRPCALGWQTDGEFYRIRVRSPDDVIYEEIRLPVHKAVGTTPAMELAAKQLKTPNGRERFLAGIVNAAAVRQAAREAKRRSVWERLNDEDEPL